MYIKNAAELAKSSHAEDLLGALEVALERVDPYKAVARVLRRVGKTVEVAGRRYEVGGAVHVVGFGKASYKMAQAAVEALGNLAAGGVVITPTEEGRLGPVEVWRGDHPIPREGTSAASRRLLDYLQGVGEGDLVLILISGGGSSLFEVPEEGVSIGDVAWITEELMKRGADILELNAVRKRLSQVKGGKLLRRVKAHRVVSLIISDVLGDRLDVIASGPTAADLSTSQEAVKVLQKYGLWDGLQDSVRAAVMRDDTVKPGDPALAKVENFLVARNIDALNAAVNFLKARGYNATIITALLQGEARHAGVFLASVAKSVALYSTPLPPPAALLAGGETVVTVKGKGVGGRNQELCLSFAMAVRGLKATAACLGTDGIDGKSPAAGALVDGYTVDEAVAAGLDPASYLDNNDSYTFFKALGRAIYTGHTGTNVGDIFIALVG